MKIVVLAGGLSPERDVSLSSGSLIANALLEKGHKVLLLDLHKEAVLDGSPDSLFTNCDSHHRYCYQVPKSEPDLQKLREEAGGGDALIGKNVLEVCTFADLVFIALHGDLGENGKLQAVFDVYGVRYTGTGYTGSLLAMDKDLSKQLMRYHGLLTPDWILCEKNDPIDKISAAVSFPCVVKPCGCGSSIGVSIVYNTNELKSALGLAKRYEDILLVEKMISGREFSVGILDGSPLPPIEIIPKQGFYDYTNKYQAGLTEEICPADIPNDIDRGLRETALQVHNALRLGDYSRVDFMLDEDDRAYCLEANTLPGMTPTSLLPQEAAAAGISYADLCERIAKMALRAKMRE